VLTSTVTTPKSDLDTIIGKNISDLINYRDQYSYRKTLQRTIQTDTHEFIDYSVGRHMFISLIIPRGQGEVIALELPAGLPSDRERQKQVLMSSAGDLVRSQLEVEVM
jgi:hypothetical protein